jgi:hypothetical protein
MVFDFLESVHLIVAAGGTGHPQRFRLRAETKLEIELNGLDMVDDPVRAKRPFVEQNAALVTDDER